MANGAPWRGPRPFHGPSLRHALRMAATCEATIRDRFRRSCHQAIFGSGLTQQGLPDPLQGPVAQARELGSDMTEAIDAELEVLCELPEEQGTPRKCRHYSRTDPGWVRESHPRGWGRCWTRRYRAQATWIRTARS